MKIKNILKTVLLLAASSMLFACGDVTKDTPESSTVLKGVAAAGIFKSGTVEIYAVKADGTLEAAPLRTTTIGADGTFTVDIGVPQGTPLVALAYGKYQDEATNTEITILKANPLRAALPATAIKAGVVTMNITALTTVAVAQTEGTVAKFSSANITTANTVIGKTFFGATSTADITTVTPVTPASLATATDDQKKYTALLALLSQYTTGSADPVTVLKSMAAVVDTTSFKFDGATVIKLQTAANTLPNNAIFTAIKAVPAANTYLNSVKDGSLLNGGTPIQIFPLKLKTVATGTDKVGSINDLRVTLPAGVSIFPSSAAGVVKSGVATAADTLVANTTGQTTRISVATGAQNGLAIGEFVTIYCGATTAPALATITLTPPKISDLQGNTITTVTVDKVTP